MPHETLPRFRRPVAIGLLLLGLAAVLAAEPSTAPAPLVYFNREIATFRVPFLGISPAERVERATLQLRRRLEIGGPLAIEARPVEGGQALLVDGAFVFLVLDGDAAPLGETSAQLAADAAARLRLAFDEAREVGSLRRLAMAAGRAALATGVLWLLVWGLVRIRRRIVDLLRDPPAEEGVPAPPAGEARQFLRSRLRGLARILVRTASVVVGALAASQWLSYVLRQFPFTRPFGETFEGWLFDRLGELALLMLHGIPGLLLAGLVFVIAGTFLRMIRPLLDRIEAGDVQLGALDRDTIRPTRRILNVAVWLFAIAMAYPYLPGSDSRAFQGLSLLVGLMVSMGGSGLVGQAASGLILMYTRTLRAGEYVRIADHEGTVVDVGTFTTRIRTGMGEERVLPNSLILGEATRNYSRTVVGPGFIVDTTITIGYDAPWRQVHALLLAAAHRVPGVVPSPAPQVFQTALSDFYVEYRLVLQASQVGPRSRAETIDALHREIQDAFNAAGVQIMSPHYLGDPADAKVVPRERWYAPPAAPPER